MSAETGTGHSMEHEMVATLVRSVPVRLIEVSRGGCRLESLSRLESGASGQLAVELAGLVMVPLGVWVGAVNTTFGAPATTGTTHIRYTTRSTGA